MCHKQTGREAYTLIPLPSWLGGLTSWDLHFHYQSISDIRGQHGDSLSPHTEIDRVEFTGWWWSVIGHHLGDQRVEHPHLV